MKKPISLMLAVFLIFALIIPVGAEETNTNEIIEEEMPVVDTGLNPLLIIENVEVDEVVAGSEFYISFVIRNIGTGPAFDLNFKFEVDEDKNSRIISKVDTSGEPEIKQIDSKAVQSVAIKMKVDNNAANRPYNLKVNVDYKNALQSSSTIYSKITVPVTYGVTEPKFIVKAVQFEPKEPDLTQPFTATIIFENISDSGAGSVSVAIDGKVGENKNFNVLDLSNTQHILNVKGKQTRMVSFNLEAEEHRDSNEVKLTFSHGADKDQTTIINLPLPKVNSSTTGKTPRVIINKYTLSDEQVLAGNTVVLKLYIENTNTKDVNNVQISLEVPKIDDDKIGGTVFSPVDSSNTFYIDKIPGKTIITKEIPLYVDPNAQAKTHIVSAKMIYEDEKGKELDTSAPINIPVTQECRFEVLSVDIPPMAFVGQPIPVAAEFVNVGKVALSNFMVNMEGDFQKENALYYIGNMETGMSDYYQAMIIPQAEGELEGMVVFTYIDNNNKEVRVEKPFTLEVQGQPEPPMGGEMGPGGFEGRPGMPGGPMGPDGNSGNLLQKFKNNWKAIVLLLIVLIQGVFIWRLRRKVKANGEFLDV
ncbi:MAG: COG1361 S-layer family protein [Peptococcales bacterium]